LCPFNKRAWHAGKSSFNGVDDCNNFSIGIELEGSDDDYYEDDQYENTVQLNFIANVRIQFNYQRPH
jgi:AmpD protein